jgi:site-specific DNA recombinase
MTAPVRAALYLRVSTGRQADSDLSIPDQRRQAEGHCKSRGWEIVADYVEPGVSATDDKRPEFQRMIDAATTKPPAFEVIVVSRFFRDQFQLEFYVRQLAKNGVRLVSITQELGDDPMSNMIRQIMALFDEYQSKENAKHTLRAMKENARQGFWNGSLPPIGYRIVEAAEQHGHRTKKTLGIDPIQAETVRLIFALSRYLISPLCTVVSPSVNRVFPELMSLKSTRVVSSLLSGSTRNIAARSMRTRVSTPQASD